MPQAAAGNQQPGGDVVFHFLPGGLNFNRRQPLLKHGQIQRVPQFEAVKRGEGQWGRVGRAPSVGFRRIGVRRVEREQQAGVGVGLHQRSSERDTSTMLGKTLSPKIWRRRAA